MRKKLELTVLILIILGCSSPTVEGPVSSPNLNISKQVPVDLIREATEKINRIEKSRKRIDEKVSLKADIGGVFYFHAKAALESGNSGLAIKYLKFALKCNPSPPYSKLTSPLLSYATDIFIDSTLRFEDCDVIKQRYEFLKAMAPDYAHKIEKKKMSCIKPLVKKAVISNLNVKDISNIQTPESNTSFEIEKYQDLKKTYDYIMRQREAFPIYEINLIRFHAHRLSRFEVKDFSVNWEKSNKRLAWLDLNVEYISPWSHSILEKRMKEVVDVKGGLESLSFGREASVSKKFNKRMLLVLKKENRYADIYYRGGELKMPMLFLRGKYVFKLTYSNGQVKNLKREFRYRAYGGSNHTCFVLDGADDWDPCSLQSHDSTPFPLKLNPKFLKNLVSIDMRYDLQDLRRRYLD